MNAYEEWERDIRARAEAAQGPPRHLAQVPDNFTNRLFEDNRRDPYFVPPEAWEVSGKLLTPVEVQKAKDSAALLKELARKNQYPNRNYNFKPPVS